MKHILIIMAMLAWSAGVMAQLPADSVAESSSAVTIASDSVIDDTSDYVVSTSIPRGLVNILSKAANNAPDNIDEDMLVGDSWWMNILGPVLGLFGVGLVFFLFAIVLLPLIIIALVIWLVVRSRRKARLQDAQTSTAVADPAQPQQSSAERFTHRRDNAIRNLCIGVGVTAVSAVLGVVIGVIAGIVVLCIGAADYLIYRNHKNNDNNNHN